MPSSHDNMSRLSSGWYLLNVTLNHVLNGNNHLERKHRVGIISNPNGAKDTKKSQI